MGMRTALVLMLVIPFLQTVPPDTEIFLASLTTDAGTLKVGQPLNITRTPGYDNQPFFTPDGRAILFTSARGGAATDIYRYDIAAERTSRVTDTLESEYSPTVTPDGKRVSVIRVEADKTQRLWQFTIDGKDPAPVLPDIKPVGYHAWIDETTLALFVLGQPPTLQVADVKTGTARTIVTDIGRSIQRMRDGGISFVRREAADGGKPSFTIMRLSRDSAGAFTTSALTPPPAPGNDPDVAWMPDGSMVAASGGRLHRWRAGDTSWTPIADLTALGISNVSRLAVSPAGDRLALVAQPR